MRGKIYKVIWVIFGIGLITTDCARNKPPIASFTYSITGNVAQFTDQSTDPDGKIDSWDWDFGDGETSTNQNPSHQYINPGTYEVVLIVTDNKKKTGSTSQIITIPNQPPTASFTYSITGGVVYFTDQSTDPDGEIDSWHWDFGDEKTSRDQNPTHEYFISGTYEVTLTVTDDNGAIDDTSQDVSVTTDYTIYNDGGIPDDAEIWTWSGEDWGRPAGSFDANYTGEAAPEGNKCFKTTSGPNWDSHTNHAGWGVFLIKPSDQTVDLSPYLNLKFWIKTPENLKIEIQQNNRYGPKFSVYISNYGWNGVNEWQEISIPANAFSGANYSRIFGPFMATIEEGDRTFYLDNVRWTY